MAAVHPRGGRRGGAARWSPRSSRRPRCVTAGGHPPTQQAVEPAAGAGDRRSPRVVPLADTAPTPTPRPASPPPWRRCVADPNLGTLTGRITDAMTGDELWAQGAGVPMQPASTNKVLTAAAALLTLDRDARLTTRCSPTRPTRGWWSSRAAVTRRCRRRRARTRHLVPRRGAHQRPGRPGARAAVSRSKAVQVDVSAYSGPTMAPGWDPLDIDGGDIAPDGVGHARRWPHPAGQRRIAAVERPPPSTRAAPWPWRSASTRRRSRCCRRVRDRAEGRIASVQSPPLIERLRDMMNASDNVMAESHRPRGRRRAATGPQSFDGAARAVLERSSTTPASTPPERRLFDSSGLSVDDRLTAETLDEVVNAAAGDATARAAPAGRPAADRRGQRHAVQPLPRHRRGPRRRGLPAGQDRLADRHQRAGGHRHRRRVAGC